MEKKDIGKKSLWFVARTVAYVELRMRTYFVDRKIDYFIPTRGEMRVCKDKVIEMETPVIRGLVFFRADQGLAENVFSQNKGVINRIRLGDDPLTVPENQMEAFMRFINQYEGRVDIFNPDDGIGEKLELMEASQSGLSSEVIRINNRDYLTVALAGLMIAAIECPKNDPTVTP